MSTRYIIECKLAKDAPWMQIYDITNGVDDYGFMTLAAIEQIRLQDKHPTMEFQIKLIQVPNDDDEEVEMTPEEEAEFAMCEAEYQWDLMTDR